MASQKINFAYCTTKSTYDSAIADGRIKDTDVVFVENSRGLFTHGIDFSWNIPIINQAGSSIQLDPDKLYVLSDLQTGTLEINLNEVNDNVMHEYLLQFTTGNTAPTLDVPDGIKWINSVVPIIKANRTYHFSIINNLAVVGEF